MQIVAPLCLRRRPRGVRLVAGVSGSEGGLVTWRVGKFRGGYGSIVQPASAPESQVPRVFGWLLHAKRKDPEERGRRVGEEREREKERGRTGRGERTGNFSIPSHGEEEVEGEVRQHASSELQGQSFST